ncbi:hypothetical protein ACFQX6_53995 [Streptosporangium lutulentum]
MTLGLPRSRVDEVLDLVGLTGREAKRTFGGYSLGMRQRLGIGHALLGLAQGARPGRARQRPGSPGHPVDARAAP